MLEFKGSTFNMVHSRAKVPLEESGMPPAVLGQLHSLLECAGEVLCWAGMASRGLKVDGSKLRWGLELAS